MEKKLRVRDYSNRSQLVEMLLIITSMNWKWKWITTTFRFIIFYCLTTCYNVMFFNYLSTYLFYLWLYSSSFLLIKSSVVQYQLTISFFMFKTCKYVSNQTVHIWNFHISHCYFSNLSMFSKNFWYQVPFHISWKFWNIMYPHLKY